MSETRDEDDGARTDREAREDHEQHAARGTAEPDSLYIEDDQQRADEARAKERPHDG